VVGKIDTSSYIYRDKPVCPLEGIIDTDANVEHWQVSELDQHQASHIAERCAMASPVLLSLQSAANVNRRALFGWWPRVNDEAIDPKRLWRIFKHVAALSELSRVDGLDPYETSVVAALIETGVAFSVKEILQHLYAGRRRTQRICLNRDGTRLRAPSFIAMDPMSREVLLGQPQTAPGGIRANGFSVEHEATVARLAYVLKSMHLLPCQSPLVDLAIIKNRAALFLEVKTANNGNLLDQVRAAIGQLLEYRFIYKGFFDRIDLAVVVPLIGSASEVAFAEGFVRNCGISLVVWQSENGQFKYLTDTIREWYAFTEKESTYEHTRFS
jgi:hypothetical protein